MPPSTITSMFNAASCQGCRHTEPPALGAVAREGRQAARNAVDEYLRRLSRRHRAARRFRGPLFRTIGRGTGKLTRTVLPQANAYAMIRRRGAAAGITTPI